MAKHRHKRETNARIPRAALIAAPVAFLATASAVTLGVVNQDPVTSDRTLLAGEKLAADITANRSTPVSRSEGRKAAAAAKAEQETSAQEAVAAQLKAERQAERRATRQAVRNADTTMWTTAGLNLWDGSGENATKVGLLAAGEEALVTGREADGRVEIVVEGVARWVTKGHLSDTEPLAGIGGSCTNGSSVPSNLKAGVQAIHRAVCARWPEITSYGTWRSDGEHGQGRAIDIMVSGQTGWDIANYLREHYADLGISYVIYAQKIWSVERNGEGWRGMSNRGSATANHYDHVHVTVG